MLSKNVGEVLLMMRGDRQQQILDIRQDLRERRAYLKASLEEVSGDLQISVENIQEIEDDRAYFNIMNANILMCYYEFATMMETPELRKIIDDIYAMKEKFAKEDAAKKCHHSD